VSHDRDAPGPHVLIASAAGFTNLGDDAIVVAMVAELREAIPDATFTVAGGSSDYGTASLARLDVETIAVRDIRAVDAAVTRSALVIVGGGGFIYDYDAIVTPYDFLRGDVTFMYPYYRAAVAASVRDVPVYFYAVGVDSLITPTGRALTRDVLSRAQAISVRDEISLVELRRADVCCPVVEVTADPAVRVDPPRVAWRTRPAGRVVAFVTRPWLRFGGTWTPSSRQLYETYVGWLAAAADHAVDTWDATPVFLPGQRYNDDDLETAARVASRMTRAQRAVHLSEVVDEEQYRAVFAGADAVVSSRLHPLILASTAGVPVVGVAINEKVRAFLTAIRLDEQIVSPWAASATSLVGALDRALRRPEQIRAEMREGIDRQRTAAARNPLIAAELLASRALAR
jgi:polysaccharide pyruvyl transferase WcaK-like protein